MTDHEQADVVILGGGPAGCATALALRTHAPSLSVALVEANGYDRPRIGEVLPAAARAPLAQLGLWEAFQAEQYQPAHSTSAAWGQAWPQAEHSLTSARGAGWHLERTRFDAWLAAQATARGVRFYTSSARLVDAQRTETNWRLCWSNELTVPTRFVVDASGRCSTFARSQGARLTSYDQLVGYARSFTLAEAAAPGTLVEAFADGWWYTTLAGGARVVVCLTDRDLAGRLGLRDEPQWLARLAETHWLQGNLGERQPATPVRVYAADSRLCAPVCSADWLAVGDAASAFDPLSSHGLVKALRAGLFAAYAIGDWLAREDDAGLQRYARFVPAEFASYQRAHARFYALEKRWPEREFWQRRHTSAGWHGAKTEVAK